MKKLRPFTQFLLGYTCILSLLCLFGWHELGAFVEELEFTLEAQVQSMEAAKAKAQQGVENTDPQKLSLNMDEYPEIRALSFQFAEKYARFVSGDLDLEAIEGYFQKDSVFLEAISSYSSRRYDDHDAVSLVNLQQLSLEDTGEGVLESRVTFDFMVEVEGETLAFPTDYSIFIDEMSLKIISLSMH